ncbi:MAG: FtsQ-type POTRA domain-containing protein [Candidatus Nealsonbacteria bacterium]|nr:FtsQ-type POTRA domain-containing protein [Candidatus Nealsonbacteria bacterium]
MPKNQVLRRPHRFKRKKPILRNRWFLIALSFIVAAVLFIYFFSFSGLFQIKKIVVSGENNVSEEEIGFTIRESIGKRILFWETNSIFWISPKYIERAILDKFPQIADVKIKRVFPDGLIFTIEERQALALYSRNGNDFFLVDKTGIVYEEVFAAKNSLFVILDKANKEAVAAGKEAMAAELFLKIWQLKEKIENLGLLLKGVEVLSEERIAFKTSEDWEVYLDRKENLDWQIEKLKLVLEKQIPAKTLQELEYIDLRFGDKAYYRYRD